MNRPTLIGLGEVLWDILPNGRKMGGAPANFAYHAQALGGRGLVMSIVGEDPDGDEIIASLQKLNLSCDYIARDPDHPTGTVTVKLDRKGSPTFTIHEDVAWDYLTVTDDMVDEAASADAICFGSLAQRGPVSRAAVRKIVSMADDDALHIFDVNIRQSFYDAEILRTSLDLANVFKISEEELPVVAAELHLPTDPDDFAEAVIRDNGLRLVALTRGPGGSVLYAEGDRVEHPGEKVKVADAIGAGDAFTAALALGLLHDETLAEISDHANHVAAYVCRKSGATPKIPEDFAYT